MTEVRRDDEMSGKAVLELFLNKPLVSLHYYYYWQRCDVLTLLFRTNKNYVDYTVRLAALSIKMSRLHSCPRLDLTSRASW